jgi:hypothetical protein
MTFVAYFDECGEEGFTFREEPHNKGSSEWFILGAALHLRADRKAIIHHHYAFRENHRKAENWHFHFRGAHHDERVGFIDHLCAAPYVCMSVAVHKPSLTKTEAFQKPYYLYFYTARLLLERVSWYCRDHRPPDDTDDGCAWLIFSARRGLHREAIEEYLALLKRKSIPNDPLADLSRNQIYWPSLATERVIVAPNNSFIGLQVADAVASGVGRAFERSAFGHTEARYIETLKPLLYKNWGSYFRYGIKIFPNLSEELRGQDRFRWASEFK